MTINNIERDFIKRPCIIGTRGSPLALSQANETLERLSKAHNLPKKALKIKIIKTSGDSILNMPLSKIGGKGLFTKEIEEKLLSKEIDIAVHSMKDVPTILPDGLEISTYLPREDERDSFISKKFKKIEDLPLKSVVGTSSLRRKAQLLNLRPDLKIVDFRGNVQSRLKKLEIGEVDATFLACAGLKRLGLIDYLNPININLMLPAVAQGAIGIENRIADNDIKNFLQPINDKNTETQILIERDFLFELEGSCQTPIGGFVKLKNDKVILYGEIIKKDGSKKISNIWEENKNNIYKIGKIAGKELKEKGGEGFFD